MPAKRRMLYIKVFRKEGKKLLTPVASYHWKYPPGVWTDPIQYPVMCSWGWHLAKGNLDGLSAWLKPNHIVFFAEGRKAHATDGEKTVFHSIRILGKPMRTDSTMASRLARAVQNTNRPWKWNKPLTRRRIRYLITGR